MEGPKSPLWTGHSPLLSARLCVKLPGAKVAPVTTRPETLQNTPVGIVQ